MTRTKAAVRTKPRILVVGGDTRNLGSKKLKELFEIEHVPKDRSSIPVFSGQTFAAVVVLRWIDADLAKKAKKWANDRKLECVEVRSIGQCQLYLRQRIPAIREYLDRLEAAEKEAKIHAEPVEIAPSSEDIPVPTSDAEGAEAKSAPLDYRDLTSRELDDYSDDELWEAFGPKFANDIKGVTKPGETYTPESFKVEVMEFLTGMSGPIIDRLMRILRAQGVISEVKGKVVVGAISEIDQEKMQAYIASNERRPYEKPSEIPNARNEIRDALYEDDEDKVPEVTVDAFRGRKALKDGRFTREELERIFRSIPETKVFENMPQYYLALHLAGLRRVDNRPMSVSNMRNYVKIAETTGIVKRVHAGDRYSFRMKHAAVEPKAGAPVPIVKPQEPIAPSSPVPPPAAQPPPVVSLPPIMVDFASGESIYKAVEGTFPQKKIPLLFGLTDSARFFKSGMSEIAWNKAAAMGILDRLRHPPEDAKVEQVIKARLSFTDEQWSYMALQFFRAQPIETLFPLLKPSNGFWCNCQECGDDFLFYLPRRCKKCRDEFRHTIDSVKGDSP